MLCALGVLNVGKFWRLRFFDVGDFVRWWFWTLTVLNVEKFLTLRVFDLEALDVGNFVR